MNTNQPLYLVLNTVQAAGADVVTSRGRVLIGAGANITPSIEAALAELLTEKTGVAATAQVQTVTVATATAGQSYGYTITFKDSLSGEYITRTVMYEAVTGDTTTTIATALTAIVNALLSAGAVDLASCTSAAAVITHTAKVTNPLFTIEALTTGITVAAPSTPGVVPIGQGANLLAEGFQTISAVPVSGNSYDMMILNYAIPISDGNTQKRDQFAQLYIYYNNSDGTIAAAFKTAVRAAFPNAVLT
jgi:hypothetical protein